MIEKQITSLTLETYYLPTMQNNIGVRTAQNNNFTWSNLDLRTVLGDMWDKYQYFNVSIVEITTAPSPTSNAPTDATCCQNIWIQGLPIVGATYDAQLKLNTQRKLLSTFLFGTANNFARSVYNGATCFTIRKEQEQCNLNIFYTTIGTASPPATSVNFPHITIILNIEGVDIDPDINMKSRMIK
jgi:hypothetical protein